MGNDLMGKKVEECSTLELLSVILNTEGVHKGPRATQYQGEWKEATVAIGKDHTAEIRLPAEDLAELNRLTETKRPTLEDLLRMQIGGTSPINDFPIQFSPEFRVAIQSLEKGDYKDVHFIIHASGYNSDTLDFVVRGNTLIPLEDLGDEVVEESSTRTWIEKIIVEALTEAKRPGGLLS